jgi:hypothetical protein
MGDIASTTRRRDVHAALRGRARLLVERAAETMLETDAVRLRQRLKTLEAKLTA